MILSRHPNSKDNLGFTNALTLSNYIVHKKLREILKNLYILEFVKYMKLNFLHLWLFINCKTQSYLFVKL